MEEEISLYDYYLVLAKRKRMIIALFVVSLIISVLYSFLCPKSYKAETTIYVIQKGGMPSILTSLPIPTELFSSLSEASSSDYLMVLLKSSSLREKIIKELNLATNEILVGKNPKKISREKMLKILDDITKVNYDKKGTISISVETKSPKLSAKIANCYVSVLEKSIFSSAKKNRIFLEKQIEKTKRQLALAEEKLRNYQEKNETLKLDSTVDKVISSYVDSKAEKMATQIALQQINSVLKRVGYFPQIYTYETEKIKLQTKLKELDSTIANFEQQFFKLPERALKLARLMRDVKLYSTIYETLAQQYIISKITEEKEDIKFQVIDKAYPPERPSKPSKKIIVSIAGIISIFIGIFLSFFLEYIENVKKSLPKQS